MQSLPATHQMQRAMFQRDSSFDGIFFIAVRTTNVFCRPSCPARKPLPENVRYFATPSEALFAGYRPCKRCRPLDSSRLPDWARRLLQDVEADPEDRFRSAELRRRGLDPARVRRLFLGRFGITFHAYVRARRLSSALQRIRDGAPLDDVVLGHGFESHSGFRTAFGKLFAATPGRSESAICVYTRIYDSPLGAMILGANQDGLCLLEFTDRRMLEAQFVTLRRLLKSPIVPGTNPHIDQTVAELNEYFAGKRRSFSMPLFAPG